MTKINLSLLLAGVVVFGAVFSVGSVKAWRVLHQPPHKITIDELRHVAAEVFSHNDEVIFAEQAVWSFQQGCADAGGDAALCATKAEAFKRATFKAYLDADGQFVFENGIDQRVSASR